MTRRKSLCVQLTLVIVLTVLCPLVYTRPQVPETPISSSTDNIHSELSTATIRYDEKNEDKKTQDISQAPSTAANSSRDVKTKTPIIGESMQVVANQLLQNPNNASVKTVLADTRIPPKIKNQVKQKIKTRHDDEEAVTENFHPGEAVPITMEELETENKVSGEMTIESSTSHEGISTWILLSNTGSNSTTPTEPTKPEEPQKKKNNQAKNKNKKPQNNNKTAPSKRPIIGSTNKSDLIASGSAINENVYNKLKDTVLSNVQKNKSTVAQKTTTSTISITLSQTEEPTTKKETLPKVTAKPHKKKNKNRNKSTTTVAPVVNESAFLPMEAKEQEIELEVSTPPTTTKKPKRTSTKKKNKTKKRKTSKPKHEDDTSVSIKTSNKTKTVKNSKKPSTNTSAISTQIYNYLSREVMPSVGVGVLGLASLVGIASYFFYPFATPVRRTIDVDKKDDLYIHNAEEYASEGNGQAEEEMLGTVLAGMPAHAKQKLNPYAAQTVHVNKYSPKKEENIRYRHVTPSSYMPNYNPRYPQQKTGIAHGAIYPEPVNYNPYSYETRHVQTTEAKFMYDKVTSAPYSPAPSYPAVEPIYAAPQTGPSGSAFGNDAASSVVYGVKPSSDSDFKPVYPYESQFYNSDTTSNPNTYASTSMYLGSNNENERHDEQYEEEPSGMDEGVDNKFVVGNVPKELSDTATPAVVPEHGPRKLNRKRRGIIARERSIAGSIDDILKDVNKNKDIYLSNEIDEIPRQPSMNLIQSIDNEIKTADEKLAAEEPTTEKIEIIENISTLPIDKTNEKSSTESDIQLETTTKAFKVYEVFPDDTKSSSIITDNDKIETTTPFKNMNTETTTEVFKSETTSTMPPTLYTDSVLSTTKRPYTTFKPEVLTYPPIKDFGFFGSFLRRLVEFKYKLGLSILQTTSDSLNRYLRSMEKSVVKASKNM